MNCIFCHHCLDAVPLNYTDYYCNSCRVNYHTRNNEITYLVCYLTVFDTEDIATCMIDLVQKHIRLNNTSWPTPIYLPLEWIFPLTMRHLHDKIASRLLSLRAFL